jgi:hypothetical protein
MDERDISIRFRWKLGERMDEQENVRDVMSDVEDAMEEAWPGAFERMREHAMYYRRDGTIIVDTPEKSATIQWAEMFEDSKGRTVAVDKTLYGERLSTVFLGLDHSFMSPGPPILFETMLFAPMSEDYRRFKRARISKLAETGIRKSLDAMNIEWEEVPEERYIKTHFPHDQLQLRYATEAQAAARHAKLKLQCRIPPRWRRFLLYRIGGDATWE